MKIKNCCGPNHLIALAVLVALITGALHMPFLYQVATVVSEIFIKLLKLVSVPIIFLSIVSTVTGMNDLNEFKHLGRKIVKYTIFTTFVAAVVALMLYLAINPVHSGVEVAATEAVQAGQKGYMTYLMQIIPSNAVLPFSENHVISVLFLALLLSLATLALPSQNRTVIHSFFSSIYAAVMKVTIWIVYLMPIGIWSFITLFIRDMRDGLELSSLALYLTCVLLANVVQGLVVLPLFVKMKGISPLKLAKGMLPALSVAFFTKSSSATLPMAMRCAEENVGISKKISNFTFPLCTTINMNGCAAFILVTVLFVSTSNGMTYSGVDMFVWTIVATIAAIGNAGVPMGCYFLSSAILASLDVPLNLLGVILPFYSMIDMLETSVNVWSDSCVVAVVDKEVAKETVAVTA